MRARARVRAGAHACVGACAVWVDPFLALAPLVGFHALEALHKGRVAHSVQHATRKAASGPRAHLDAVVKDLAGWIESQRSVWQDLRSAPSLILR